jgi:hypothetical protein
MATISRFKRGRVAQHRNDRRRRLEGGKALGKIRLATGDQPSAHPDEIGNFARHIFFRRHIEFLSAAACRHARQFGQGRAGIAEARDQAGEGDGSDILGARQPDPGAPFAVAKRSHFFSNQCAAPRREAAAGYFPGA